MKKTMITFIVLMTSVAAIAEEASAPQKAVTQEVIVISEAPQSTSVTQPTTVVEASPLVPSKAEEIRNARQRAEVETEQKIVEKLEASRLEDEQKRMDRVFGNKLEAQKEAVVVIASPTPSPVPQKSEEQLKSEIAESIKADLAKVSEEEKPSRSRVAVGAAVGQVSYDSLNVSDDVGGGFEIAWRLDSQFIVDFGMLYSRHYIDDINYNFQRMDQYNWIAGVKYALLKFKVSPVVGAVASYTRRDYTRPYAFNSRETSSDALDVGLSLGVDFSASENFSIALDYKAMRNIDANYESEALNRPLAGGNWIEELDYDIVSVSAKFVF